MEFFTGFSIFYTVKLSYYLCTFLIFLAVLLVFPKKLKKYIARVIINKAQEKHYFTINMLLFFISTILAIFLSVMLMKHLKIAAMSQFALIFTTIEVARFAFCAFYNKWPVSFSVIKEYLYKYLQK